MRTSRGHPVFWPQPGLRATYVIRALSISETIDRRYEQVNGLVGVVLANHSVQRPFHQIDLYLSTE